MKLNRAQNACQKYFGKVFRLDDFILLFVARNSNVCYRLAHYDDNQRTNRSSELWGKQAGL